MTDLNVVWTLEDMKRKYGLFYQESPKVCLDKGKIPKQFWPLLAYAAFWGLSDDLERENLVLKAPPEVQHNLKKLVAAFDNALCEWLAGPEAANPNPSDEYVAYSAMIMAADFISERDYPP